MSKISDRGYLCNLLRTITAIVLLTSMLGQTFSRYMLVLDYQLNKAYIARNLCENRDKPAMKCEGKCYLCKRLKKEDKKDQENPERRADYKFEIIFFMHEYRETRLFRPFIFHSYPYFQEQACGCFTSDCFHPPQC